MRQIAENYFRRPPTLPAQPPILHELYDLLFRPHLANQEPLPREFIIETRYADHRRRPHRGLRREVRLRGDFATWYHDINCHDLG